MIPNRTGVRSFNYPKYKESFFFNCLSPLILLTFANPKSATMAKTFYRLPQLPLEEDWLQLRPSLQYYFRPWVNLTVEMEGSGNSVEIPASFLGPEDMDFFQSFDC